MQLTRAKRQVTGQRWLAGVCVMFMGIALAFGVLGMLSGRALFVLLRDISVISCILASLPLWLSSPRTPGLLKYMIILASASAVLGVASAVYGVFRAFNGTSMNMPPRAYLLLGSLATALILRMCSAPRHLGKTRRDRHRRCEE